jgi:hypothetical protein
LSASPIDIVLGTCYSVSMRRNQKSMNFAQRLAMAIGLFRRSREKKLITGCDMGGIVHRDGGTYCAKCSWPWQDHACFKCGKRNRMKKELRCSKCF